MLADGAGKADLLKMRGFSAEENAGFFPTTSSLTA